MDGGGGMWVWVCVWVSCGGGKGWGVQYDMLAVPVQHVVSQQGAGVRGAGGTPHYGLHWRPVGCVSRL